MMDDELQQAAEDIALIKSVLERTTISFATLRPAFLGLAKLWLIYALSESGSGLCLHAQGRRSACC